MYLMNRYSRNRNIFSRNITNTDYNQTLLSVRWTDFLFALAEFVKWAATLPGDGVRD